MVCTIALGFVLSIVCGKRAIGLANASYKPVYEEADKGLAGEQQNAEKAKGLLIN
jgi:hypothetical protein